MNINQLNLIENLSRVLFVVSILLFSSNICAQISPQNFEPKLKVFEKASKNADDKKGAASCPYKNYLKPISDNQEKIDNNCKVAGSSSDLMRKKEAIKEEYKNVMLNINELEDKINEAERNINSATGDQQKIKLKTELMNFQEDKEGAEENAEELERQFDNFNRVNGIDDLIDKLEICLKYRKEQKNVFNAIVQNLKREPKLTFFGALETQKREAKKFAENIIDYMEDEQKGHDQAIEDTKSRILKLQEVKKLSL